MAGYRVNFTFNFTKGLTTHTSQQRVKNRNVNCDSVKCHCCKQKPVGNTIYFNAEYTITDNIPITTTLLKILSAVC